MADRQFLDAVGQLIDAVDDIIEHYAESDSMDTLRATRERAQRALVAENEYRGRFGLDDEDEDDSE